MNRDEWERLDKMASRAPGNLSGGQWAELIEYARDQIGQFAAPNADWFRKQSEYESSKAQEETRLAEQLKAPTPAPEIDRVQQDREQLMAVFKVGGMDANTVKLVEFLIRLIPLEKFQPANVLRPAKENRELLDFMMVRHCRGLVESDGMGLLDAYKATDKMYKQTNGSTATRFSRLSKKKAPAGDVHGEKYDQPLHPDIVEFLEKYHDTHP
jgi:hypothetical protein